MRLTDLQIRKLKAPVKGQRTHFDDALPGFGLRVSQGGRKSFVVMFGKRRQLVTLGRYPDLSLAEARREAKRVQADTDLPSKPAAPTVGTMSFAEARERFLQDSALRNKPRTTADYKRLLNRHYTFAEPIGLVTRAKIMRAVDKLRETPSEQAHAYVALRTMMSWCVKRGLLEHSPVPSLSFRQRARDRVLTDEELALVWRRAEEIGYPFGTIVQLLILTGQRRGEVAGLRQSWLRDDTVIFPTGFTKNKREHRLPLGPLAMKIIDTVPRTGDLLFPSRHDLTRPFNGWGKSKERFDADLPIAPYTLHDLRRTFSSNMARMGTPLHITERALNHVSGSISGVAAIYNRYQFSAEIREAMKQYETFIPVHSQT